MISQKTIALVDDHTLFRRGVAQLISHLSIYQVLFQASDGTELMEQIERGQLPDVVLLDIHMPKMDGYATAEWLVKHHSSVKILALSMYDDEPSVIRMFRSGARGYILKDAQPEELDQLLRRGYYHADFVAEILMKNSGVSLAQKE